MLADFYISRLENDMNLAVEKNHFGGKILYRSLDPSKKRRLCKPVRARDANGRNFPTPPRVNRFGNLNTIEGANVPSGVLNGTRISIRNHSISSQHKRVTLNTSMKQPRYVFS